MEGILFFEDGQIYRGKGFGAAATNIGEIVFNTAMGGYQEALTDPAASGLIVNMTYPLIGNYGISEIDNESENIHVSGLVVRDISFRPSNRLSVMSISEWLKSQGVPGVYNVDTRAVTKKIRADGTQKCVISTEGISREQARELIARTPLETGDVNKTEIKRTGVNPRVFRPGSAAENVPGKGLKIAALDFGIKKSLVTVFTGLGCDLILCPDDTSAEEILGMNVDALLLSGGPETKAVSSVGVNTVAALIGRLPILGIGSGHLVLALAAGASIYKLKFGHHGSNHGVIDIETDKAAITSQSHSLAVDASSLNDSGMIVTHLNLNDQTVEGIRHKNLPVFSLAFGPEGAPGSCDTKWVFNSFIRIVKGARSFEWKGGSLNA